MMAVVRVLLLILGILAIIFGVEMYVDNQSYLEKCESPWFRLDWEDNCRIAEGNRLFGIISMVAGIGLFILGAISIAVARSMLERATFNCPQCRTTIFRHSSPKNCANCGLPIDWDKAKPPQK